ncbi:MAG TPA: enoyl-CoA hydratase-related protein, partial [Burkholderiales bacterium]|nr:enoyl-CoA hydratase-related protein [Burkholderiales bacterium]
RLPRLVGPGRALEMILSAQPIDAARAREIGLVERVVPAASLMAESVVLAQTIASRSPRAVRTAREAVHRGLELPLHEALKLEQSLADPLRDGDDNREAREAFAQKREPNWTGR